MNLLENSHFQDWVTDAVCQVLGQSACGLDRKWALTYAETRMVASQEGLKVYFNANIPAAMRLAEEAFANLVAPTGKRHLH